MSTTVPAPTPKQKKRWPVKKTDKYIEVSRCTFTKV